MLTIKNMTIKSRGIILGLLAGAFFLTSPVYAEDQSADLADDAVLAKINQAAEVIENGAAPTVMRSIIMAGEAVAQSNVEQKKDGSVKPEETLFATFFPKTTIANELLNKNYNNFFVEMKYFLDKCN